MKKLSLLVGTLGGAMAGYLFSNKKLREELSQTKDAEDAAKLLGLHLQRDGKKLAKQIQEFIDSDEVQNNVQKAKKFTKKKVDEAKKEMNALVSEGADRARTVAKKAKTRAKTAAKKGKAKAQKTVKRAAKKAKSTARKTVRRVKLKKRTLS